MKIISVASMRDLDRQTILAGTSELLLMQQAGDAAYGELSRFVKRRFPASQRRRYSVLAGKGNNGGDAYVVARRLAEDGQTVRIFATCPQTELKGAAADHAAALPETVPVVVCSTLPKSAFAPGTIVIDGLLGTGVSGPLRAPFDTMIPQINRGGRPVIALDVPSGLDADTGRVASEAVSALLTVTMSHPKRGMLSASGLEHCGIIRCVDIGILEDAADSAAGCGEAVVAADVAHLLGARPANAHKGSFGHLLVLGGSRHYTGAPLLSGAAALRMGTGLATVAVPESVRPLISPPLLALIVRSLPDGGNGFFNERSCESARELLVQARALVFGPGLGDPRQATPLLREVLAANLPTVIDADGLRCLAAAPELASGATQVVLTPHPGEMRVLLKGFGLESAVAGGRSEQALALARCSGMHVVLKGQGTVLATPDGRWALNLSGTNALATAGTGDVLAGMIGGLLAQGLDVWDAMRAATFVHGYAAELAPCGNRSLVADDLLNLLGPTLQELTPFA
jgi:NAD(P)H-hydrate epimerase